MELQDFLIAILDNRHVAVADYENNKMQRLFKVQKTVCVKFVNSIVDYKKDILLIRICDKHELLVRELNIMKNQKANREKIRRRTFELLVWTEIRRAVEKSLQDQGDRKHFKRKT